MLRNRILECLERIENKLNILIKKENKMDVTIDQILAEATSETTLQGSIITLINSIQAQLTAALSGTTIPPDVQAKMNAVFSTLTSNDAAVTAAITANTPIASPVAPPVTPAPSV